MRPRFFEFVHEGVRHVLVGPHDTVEFATKHDALRLLQRALDEDPGAASWIVRRAHEVRLLGERPSLREAMHIVADAIACGRLIPIRLRYDMPAPSSTAVTDLREIGRDDPRLGPAVPAGGGREDDDRLRMTFVSFEVVDDEGRHADGDFRFAIDAQLEEGPLDRRSHRFDPIREQALVQLLVENLRWDDPDVPSVQPGGPGVEPQEDPDAPEPDAPGRAVEEATFVLEDEEGAPVVGERFMVRFSDGTVLEGETDDAGLARVEIPEGLTCEITFPDREGSTWS